MLVKVSIENFKSFYQAYMKQHQKEIEREAARLIREGLIKIE